MLARYYCHRSLFITDLRLFTATAAATAHVFPKNEKKGSYLGSQVDGQGQRVEVSPDCKARVHEEQVGSILNSLIFDCEHLQLRPPS